MKKRSSKLSLDNGLICDLILFCIFSVEQKKEQCTFERLTEECFGLFPKPFGLKRYPKWPDTRKLDRSLRSLRAKKLIKGDPKSDFSLTSQGRKEAQEIAKMFRQKKLL